MHNRLTGHLRFHALALLGVALVLISSFSCAGNIATPVTPEEAPAPMNLNDLTVNFANIDRGSIIAEWHWLTTDANVPILITLAGDAFLQSMESGAVSFLNTAECSLTEVAPDHDSFQAKLGDKAFVIQHFRVDMIAPLIAQAPEIAPHQLYSLKKPLILGGEWDASNLELCDLEVHFSILGQISRHVSALPPGTSIGNVTIEDN